MTLVNLDRETMRNMTGSAHGGIMVRMRSFVAGNRAVRQLHQLDDRLLADIGLNRSDISVRVWGK